MIRSCVKTVKKGGVARHCGKLNVRKDKGNMIRRKRKMKNGKGRSEAAMCTARYRNKFTEASLRCSKMLLSYAW
jgi:hypothetical protein